MGFSCCWLLYVKFVTSDCVSSHLFPLCLFLNTRACSSAASKKKTKGSKLNAPAFEKISVNLVWVLQTFEEMKVFETSVDLEKAEKEYKEKEPENFYVLVVYLNMGAAEQFYLLFKEKFGGMGKEDLKKYKKVYYTVDDGRILDILDGVESGAILKDKLATSSRFFPVHTYGHIYVANRQAAHLLYDKICETYPHCAMRMMGLQTKEEA